MATERVGFGVDRALDSVCGVGQIEKETRMRKYVGGRHRSRRAASMATVTVSLAAALSIAFGGSVIGGRDRRPGPSLGVLKRHSFTVRGRHFKPRMSVRLTLMAAHSFSRHARPNTHGEFTITFPTWSIAARPGRCPRVRDG